MITKQPAAIMAIGAANLLTRWFHRAALAVGWLAGMIAGTIAAYQTSTPTASHCSLPAPSSD